MNKRLLDTPRLRKLYAAQQDAVTLRSVNDAEEQAMTNHELQAYAKRRDEIEALNRELMELVRQASTLS